LAEKETSAVCLSALADLGCRPPSNHLVLFCLKKALLGTSSLLGAAAGTRVDAMFLKIPAVRKFVERLLMLNRQERDREKLRKLLHAELTGSSPTAPPVDLLVPLEVTNALYQKKRLDDLGNEYKEHIEALQQAIASMLADIERDDREPRL